MEGITKIKTGKLLTLSVQQLIDCVKGSSCDGGYIEDAFSYIIKSGGITSASNYHYKAANGNCSKYRSYQHAAKIRGYVNLPQNNEAALLKAVAKQPDSVSIDASSKEFQLYSSGVFTGKCDTSLDHGVTVVGYGVAHGVKYWLVKNSWGTGWGENGYIRIQRNPGFAQGRCGIAMESSYPTA